MKSKYQGIIFIIISAFFFALMNLFVRLSGDLPTMQKAFFRNAVAAVVALVLLLRRPSDFKTAKGNWLSLIVRSVAGVIGIILNFYAIDRLDIADASILNKLSPFFAIVFSFIIMKEKPSLVEWLAVIVAFGGAMFVVRPSFDGEVVPALCGFGGGLAAGLAYAFVRRASANGAARNLIIFVFSAFSSVVLLPFMIVQFKPMEWDQLLYLFLAGTSAAGGQIFITMAYSRAPAKEISVFDYSIVIFAAILGFIVLGQIPDPLSYIGYAIIIGAAVAVWLYHIARDKRVSALEGVNDKSAPDVAPTPDGEVSASDDINSTADPPGENEPRENIDPPSDESNKM